MPQTNYISASRQKYIIPDSLTQSSGIVTAVVAGITYNVTLSALSANTLYYLYLLAGTLSFSTSVPSTFRGSNPDGQLVGAFYANGNASVLFGDFVNIEGSPRTFSPVQYNMVIGGATTPPTKGTTTTDIANWLRDGDHIEVTYNFKQTGAGSAGSGTYLFPLPSGFTANLTTDTTTILGNVGSGMAFNGTLNGVCYVSLFNTTNMILNIYNTNISSNTTGAMASTVFPLTGTNVNYSFTARIPIVGLSSKSLKDL